MKIEVRLSPAYYIGMAFLSMLWGLGLIIHFFVNNRVFPRFIDDQGVTTRNGKKYRWEELENWERHRLVVGASGGPRITGNITLFFTTGKVIVGSFPIENLSEVLSFLSAKLGDITTPG